MRHLLWLAQIAIPALFLVACGEVIEDRATSGGGDPCPPGAHRDDKGACEGTLSAWVETSSLVHWRWGHVTFTADTPKGAFLYVAAGFPNDDIERAEIHPDGSLGPFTVLGEFPMLMENSGFVQSGRTMLIVGGMNGDTSLADSLIGTVADDGSVSFAPGPKLGAPRESLTLSYHGGFVYAVGGGFEDTGGYPTAGTTVERAPFDGTTLGAFEPLDPIPQPLQDHVAVVVNDALYLIGGNTDPINVDFPSADVWRAPFTADGRLGPFAKAGALVSGRYWASAFSFLDQISVLGGADKNSIVTATVRADGSVGAFDQTSVIPFNRWSAGPTPIRAGFVYWAGGSGGADGERERVFVGKLN